MIRRKALHRVQYKSGGNGRAVFATYGVVDHDGDVTERGAFTDGAEVPISGWNHSSWQPGQLPVGKAIIRDRGDRVEAELTFLDTPDGQAHRDTLRELAGLTEWSYGYDILDAEPGVFDGRSVQFLKRLRVHEVSPVLLGAGIGTGTISLSSRELAARELARFVRTQSCIAVGDPVHAGGNAPRRRVA